MKIGINLAVLPSARERYALAWALPLGLLGLAGFVLLSIFAFRILGEYRNIQRDFGKLREQESVLEAKEKALTGNLEQPHSRLLSREAQFVNALIEKRQLSLTEMTVEVSKLLPKDVRLTALGFSPQEGASLVRFNVAGRNEEALEDFLSNLEDSSEFKDVAVLNQGFQPAGAAGGPVLLLVSARYAGGRSE